MAACQAETNKFLDRRRPMKKLSELIKECKEKGISIPEGTKTSKEDLIRKLANHHLEHNPTGLPPLEQFFPQLAKDIEDLSEEEKEEALRSDQYACGEKKNGIRGILHIRPEGNRFTSRNRCANTYLLNELTDNVPHLKSLDLKDFEGSIFDGELYLSGEFVKLDTFANALEATTALLHCSPDKAMKFQESTGQRIHYHIFDVLRANGQDLTTRPLRERVQYLKDFQGFIKSSGHEEHVRFEELVFHDKEEYFRKIIDAGGEGIVLKDLDAPYFPGARSSPWLKLKRSNTTDAIIIGHDRGKEWDKKGLIGSIELGIFDECGDLRSIGKVSSMPFQKRLEMTELIDGVPALKKQYLGNVVECRFLDLNKNLKARHLQIVNFRTAKNSKPISECFLDLSKEKEKLIHVGIPIPASLNQNLLDIGMILLRHQIPCQVADENSEITP
jgi:ATP-dependent DNA ligase